MLCQLFSRSVGKVATLLLILTSAFTVLSNQDAEAKTKFTVGKSIYAGWMPWWYAEESGILQKHASHYGIQIELREMDYIASVEAYVAGQLDGCVMTNMECLDMPSASGVDSTVLIMGDYSNGNDAILTRDGIGVHDLPGNDIFLVELSVSHFLLARCLEQNGHTEEQVTIVNTSDSDIGPVFISNENQKVVVTWNPIVMNIAQEPGVNIIYTSKEIPGEILDLMVVNSKTLKENPEFGKALVGTWYEMMGILSQRGNSSQKRKAFELMASAAGTTVVELKKQFETTAMFYSAKKAADYTKSTEIQTKMNFVRQFCDRHGLFGESGSVEEIGVQYPDGTVQGDANNVTMRFDASFMEMAANGELTVQ